MTSQMLPSSPPPDSELEYTPVDDQGVAIPDAETAMPETGGVALFSLYTPGGSEIKFTVRSWTVRGAIDRVFDAAQYAKTKYGWTGHPPKAQNAPVPATVVNNVSLPATAPVMNPAPVPTGPAPAPVPQGPVRETIEVKTVFHDVGGNGTHHLRIKGGQYTKFGVAMWAESMPPGLMETIMAWPLKQEYAAPAGMGHAVIEKKGDKVKVVELKP